MRLLASAQEDMWATGSEWIQRLLQLEARVTAVEESLARLPHQAEASTGALASEQAPLCQQDSIDTPGRSAGGLGVLGDLRR